MCKPHRCLTLVLSVLATLLMAGPVQCQEVTAAVTGVITDPSGAAVTGAKITAKDLDRGTVFTTVSDSSGAYNIPRLPVGSYEVRAENPGFQTALQSHVLLVVNQVAKIDFQLTVGNVNQTVDVTAAAPILQTETTQLGTIIDSKTNVSLPLATRNYNQLTLLPVRSLPIRANSPGRSRRSRVAARTSTATERKPITICSMASITTRSRKTM